MSSSIENALDELAHHTQWEVSLNDGYLATSFNIKLVIFFDKKHVALADNVSVSV